ncbi:amino acid ABC transporter substrate-binding protein [Geminicoccaceae bacterium 1502E]|nr:amino acid ABC transporter substrate-binding protein [Geminicoccaceae bacterium 1502E]
MGSWIRGATGCVAAVAGMVLAAQGAVAGPTLDAIKAHGKLRCGVSPSSAGFAYPDDKGRMLGLDAEVCRAVAAAALGDGDKVEFVPLTTNVRFQALQSGEVDLLSRQTTATFSRDVTLGMNFAPVVFYDGQGVMVPKSLGVKSAKDLDGAAICILPGTTTEQNIADWFRTRGMTFESVVFEQPDEWRNAFFQGRCDVLTTDRSDLASSRAVANNPADYVILPETISKEPLAPVVRHGDDQWLDIVTWTVNGLIAAEEKGITQENAAKLAAESQDPEIQRMLGTSEDLGAQLGLDKDWLLRAITTVGNYGEMFDRNLGPGTPLDLERGQNTLWTDGGLLYAPPFR